MLYLDEPYAELCFSKIFDFEGVKLRSVQKAGDLRINWKTEETDRYGRRTAVVSEPMLRSL